MKPTSEEVNDAIDQWHGVDIYHDGYRNLSLARYLGWSIDEYFAWFSDPSKIPDRPLRKWDD